MVAERMWKRRMNENRSREVNRLEGVMKCRQSRLGEKEEVAKRETFVTNWKGSRKKT